MLENAEKQAALCKLFANPRRLLILWALAEGELCVQAIADEVGSSLQNVSQHLSLLKRSGIVATRRDGQTVFYQIVDSEYTRQCPALLQSSAWREKT
jgi:ArsR family transcriptional regulator, virulence genes transcriptional regulator